MITKNLFHTFWLLVAALATTACSNNDDVTTISIDNGEARTWHVTINAGPAQTRAISVGGNNGSTLYYNWDDGDEVQVLKDGAVVGTLTADASEGNSAYAKLTGTLTGTFAVNDVLTLCYHSSFLHYSGQSGRLSSVSSSYSYLTATATVMAVNQGSGLVQGGTGYLTMSDAAFTPLQSYLDLTFTDESGADLNIEKLSVWTSGGKLVKDGSTYATAYSPLHIEPSDATSHFFIALRDEAGAGNYIYFKAKDEDDKIYVGSCYKNLETGHYYTGEVEMELHVPTYKYLNTDGSMTTTRKTNSVALVAFEGKATGYFDHFLAIALEDCNGFDAVGDFAFMNSVTIGGTTYNTNSLGTNHYYDNGNGELINGEARGWRIPTVTDWCYIFEGLCDGPEASCPSVFSSDTDYGDGDYFYDVLNAATGNFFYKDFYRASTEFYMDEYQWGYDFYSSRICTSSETGRFRAVFAY